MQDLIPLQRRSSFCYVLSVRREPALVTTVFCISVLSLPSLYITSTTQLYKSRTAQKRELQYSAISIHIRGIRECGFFHKYNDDGSKLTGATVKDYG